MNETKKCKYCQTDIPQKAKVCPNCKRKIKGGHGCLIAILIFIIMICVGLALSVSEIDDVGNTSDTQQNSKYITMDEYNQIQNGMTHEEVANIIGSAGELSSTSSYGGYTIEMYSWYGDGFTGANANVTFENGLAIGKAQVGLH